MSRTRVASVEGDGLRDALGDARSILLLTSEDEHRETACPTLSSSGPAAETKFLCVTADEAPDAVIDRWRTHLGDLPAETGIVAIGETTRSAAATATLGPSPAGVSIDSVADPSDLTGIAMAIGGYLDMWSGADTSVVCFQSITSLLFHTDRARVFRFLHSTTGRLRDIGAMAHYHLDPSACEPSTVNMFSALFDAVVRVEDGGSIVVETRR